MGKCLKTIGIIVVVLAIYIAYTSRDTFDPDSIRGKRVIVTGASTGIGEQVAYQYAKLGANVLITARRENLLKQVTAKCLELGAQSAHYLPLDMANINETGKLITEAEKKLGGLDYLILNHALYYWELWDGDIDRLQKLMNINFVSYVNLATKALPMLSKTNGSIVVVSSGAGFFPFPGIVSFSAVDHSKGGFFEGLRHELQYKKMDVAITLFVPGNIGTESASRMIKQMDVGGILDYTASPEDTAMALVKSGAAGQKMAYFPWVDSRPLEIIHTLSRDLHDYIISLLIYPYLDKGDKSKSDTFTVLSNDYKAQK